MENWFKKKQTKVKVKQHRITAKDIQDHIKFLDEELNKVQAERVKYRDILKKMSTLDPTDDKEEYDKLLHESQMYADADTRYTLIQEQREKEYTILKKYKDSRFYITPKDLAIILGLFVACIFTISLERDNPKSIKLASFVLKLFPIKI